jgi:hypothetical protein
MNSLFHVVILVACERGLVVSFDYLGWLERRIQVLLVLSGFCSHPHDGGDMLPDQCCRTDLYGPIEVPPCRQAFLWLVHTPGPDSSQI